MRYPISLSRQILFSQGPCAAQFAAFSVHGPFCMMLVFLIGEFGVCAGECGTVWARSAAETTPAPELTAIEFPVEGVSEPRKLN